MRKVSDGLQIETNQLLEDRPQPFEASSRGEGSQSQGSLGVTNMGPEQNGEYCTPWKFSLSCARLDAHYTCQLVTAYE